jgi:lipopolysaccharide transport system permease protein
VPLVLGACVPMLLGLAWLLAGLGVFVRDIAHAMGPAVSMLLFLSPVLYPARALPGLLANLLWLNPLTVPIENLRRVVLGGQPPDFASLGVYTLAGLVFAILAWRLFERVRPAFSDEV